MLADILTIAGLLMNLAGVILLFRYGMPDRISTGGSSMYVSSSTDPRELRTFVEVIDNFVRGSRHFSNP
jgi:hypothetical protein